MNHTECEEPRCTQKAAKTWHGRHVCSDHYEQHKEEHERTIMSLRDY